MSTPLVQADPERDQIGSIPSSTGVVALPTLDKRSADEALERARAALADGRAGDACKEFVAALSLHPGLMSAYREVGLLLAELGLAKAAEQCYRGMLPEPVLGEWFGADFEAVVPATVDALSDAPGDGQATAVRDVPLRKLCYTPRTRSLRAPRGIAAPTDRMFDRDAMTSSLALVDRIEGGSLWFDGFNRIALDQQGRSIEQHVRGNPAVVRSVMERTRPHHLPGRAFFVGNRGYANYYHWMLDILPSVHLFEQAGYAIGPDDHVVVFAGESRFQRATLEHVGFSPDRIIQLGRTSPWVSADEMVMPFYENSMAITIGDWVPEFLQARFLRGAPAGAANDLDTPAKLYLARAKEARNGRSIGNEAELIVFLEGQGFTTVYLEEYSVFEQARLMASAEMVVAAHGAGLTNIVFCRPGTKIVELYGNFMATCYWAVSEVCELDYVNHCCSVSERSIHYHQRSQKDLADLRQRGFSVDLKELAALLEVARRG